MTKQELMMKLEKFSGKISGYNGTFKLNPWEKNGKFRVYVNWKESVGYFTIDATDTNPRGVNFGQIGDTGIYAQGNMPRHTTILRLIIESL